IYRPAAIDQLETIGRQLDIPVYSMGDKEKVETIVENAMNYAKEEHLDTVIIDTAGRLHIDEAIMEELKNVKEISNQDEIKIVIDSMTGQNEVNVEESFKDILNVKGGKLRTFD